MLDAAIASGNENEVATIVKYARAADPASGDAVLRVANEWRTVQAKDRETRIVRAGWTSLWTGRAEIGGFVTTGNSETAGVTGILDLTREGLEWRHKIRGQADFQRSLGITTREHYLAAYEPNWKVDSRKYVYGALQYESDRFLGYTDRFSASAGAGYSAVQTSALTLNLELGPAFRHTDFTDATTESSIAARGNVDLDWKLTSGLTLRQDASAYLQRYNSTVSSTTAMAARLLGPLSAQLSYTVQYESMPPIGRVSTDTTSRASLVYTF
ncbi:hypothetical protein SPHI_23700 [Sphingomonas jeddahensis]|uniref:Salt-induced outer membrane protein n=2 Tax=Sphingomonas jeddahensis TaxID=1915074 RepID=A0A1V2ES07_9SPHN|nr:hypothetical protein SPHI_23700 [Sphingomonas jeddahensis]